MLSANAQFQVFASGMESLHNKIDSWVVDVTKHGIFGYLEIRRCIYPGDLVSKCAVSRELLWHGKLI